VILTPPILVRLAAIALFTAIAQLSFFAQLSFWGSSPDFALLVVMSLALLGGSVPGAVSGFSIGLLIDMLSFETLGATALTLLAVGYVAGRYRETLGPPDRGATILLAGGLTLMALLLFAGIQVLLRVGADVSPLIIRDMILVTLLGMALAVPVFAGVRRLLRSALIEDQTRARRPVAPAPMEGR
jgi:rod shape-determining protein MreD